MRNSTNTILKIFYRYGYEPTLEPVDKTKELRISINIGGGVLSFYSEGSNELSYSLSFRYGGKLNGEKVIELYRIFRTDRSTCFSSLDYNESTGEISLIGHRAEDEITPMLTEFILEESVSLRTVFKIREIARAATEIPDQYQKEN